MIEELTNCIKAYAWGSRSALRQLRGEAAPSSEPEAELWMGAHPLGSSGLAGGRSLLEAIDASPHALLGARVVSEFGPRLPFLLKVLAAAEPLSLQAHPSKDQAEAGFAADELAGIALTSPNRNYKDRNHKPELLCALSEFWALRGFREVEDTLALLSELAVPELHHAEALLRGAPDERGISGVFSWLMQAPRDQQIKLAQLTADRCRTIAGRSTRFGSEFTWGARIAELYPGDPGVVVSLLLNLVQLQPGQAIYLPAGNLHAYLGGTGVELMASSDNVLRGGLTPKHVDVRELLRVLDFRPLPPEIVTAQAQQGESVYSTPAREFQLSYFDATNAEQEVEIAGPEIWLVTQGHVRLQSTDGPVLELDSCGSAFVAASAKTVRLSGEGRVFRAKVAGC